MSELHRMVLEEALLPKKTESQRIESSAEARQCLKVETTAEIDGDAIKECSVVLAAYADGDCGWKRLQVQV